MQPTQIVLLLDVDGPLSDDEVGYALPAERHSRVIVRATELGAPRIERRGGVRAEADWGGLAEATARLGQRVRELRVDAERPFHLFVGGLAPLPLFFQLGLELSRWAERTTFVNRRAGRWETFDLSVPPTEEPFAHPEGVGPARDVDGRVAVLLTTRHRAPPEVLRAAVNSAGGSYAGQVALVATPPGELTAENCGAALKDLTAVMTEVRNSYPNAEGLAVFLAGPAPFAFMAGAAVNPTITPDVWVMNYADGEYSLALTLPWSSRSGPNLDESEEAVGERADVRADLARAVSVLQEDLSDADLPAWGLTPVENFVERLRGITIDETTLTTEFSLSVAKGKVRFGHGLLDALREVKPSDRLPIGELLLLHEVFHYDQKLLSSNFHNIGRAGLALEEVDYWADCFALECAIRRRVRENVREAASEPECVRLAAAKCINAHLAGLQVFDRAQHGDRIDRLAERRLRRYLIWHVQRERLATVRTLADVEVVLGDRVIVQLAPLDSVLDGRGDKVVRRARANTEVVVVVQRRLRRFSSSNVLDVTGLVEAVRAFDEDSLHLAMEFIVEQEPSIMTPWVT